MLTIGEKMLGQIEEVSIDMRGNYKSLVRKICPNAEVTVDRFHIEKMIHEELNQAKINNQENRLKPYITLFISKKVTPFCISISLVYCDFFVHFIGFC